MTWKSRSNDESQEPPECILFSLVGRFNTNFSVMDFAGEMVFLVDIWWYVMQYLSFMTIYNGHVLHILSGKHKFEECDLFLLGE